MARTEDLAKARQAPGFREDLYSRRHGHTRGRGASSVAGTNGNRIGRPSVAHESPTIRADPTRTGLAGIGASGPNGPAVTDRGPYGHGRD